MLFQAFSTTKRENTTFGRYALMFSDKSFHRALIIGPGKNHGRCPGTSSAIEKLRAVWGEQAPSGSFDSARPSAVSPGKSQRRFAQAKPRDLQFRGPLLETRNMTPKTELSSQPERTRISCHAALQTNACASFSKESRKKFANANMKSGAAQWRDLRLLLVLTQT
jgi:hypothetical protein